ncbi:MAG: hypothetical protein WDO73_26010 [Ignavibacteriota bacterium]
MPRLRNSRISATAMPAPNLRRTERPGFTVCAHDAVDPPPVHTLRLAHRTFTGSASLFDFHLVETMACAA